MQSTEIIRTGLILVGIVFFIVGVPCVLVAWIGFRLIKNLSLYPSKTPAIQMSILFQLIVVEGAAMTMLMTFYHVMSSFQ